MGKWTMGHRDNGILGRRDTGTARHWEARTIRHQDNELVVVPTYPNRVFFSLFNVIILPNVYFPTLIVWLANLQHLVSVGGILKLRFQFPENIYCKYSFKF